MAISLFGYACFATARTSETAPGWKEKLDESCCHAYPEGRSYVRQVMAFPKHMGESFELRHSKAAPFGCGDVLFPCCGGGFKQAM